MQEFQTLKDDFWSCQRLVPFVSPFLAATAVAAPPDASTLSMDQVENPSLLHFLLLLLRSFKSLCLVMSRLSLAATQSGLVARPLQQIVGAWPFPTLPVPASQTLSPSPPLPLSETANTHVSKTLSRLRLLDKLPTTH